MNIVGARYKSDALQNNRLKNDPTLGDPLPTSYAVKLRRESRYRPFPDPARQYVVALGGQTNNFFSSRLPLTILVDSSIQVDTGILVRPILINAEKRIDGGCEADSGEISLAC